MTKTPSNEDQILSDIRDLSKALAVNAENSPYIGSVQPKYEHLIFEWISSFEKTIRNANSICAFAEQLNIVGKLQYWQKLSYEQYVKLHPIVVLRSHILIELDKQKFDQAIRQASRKSLRDIDSGPSFIMTTLSSILQNKKFIHKLSSESSKFIDSFEMFNNIEYFRRLTSKLPDLLEELEIRTTTEELNNFNLQEYNYVVLVIKSRGQYHDWIKSRKIYQNTQDL